MTRNQSVEYRMLVAIASSLEPEYLKGDAAWSGSPFAWIKTRPSRQVGAIGEKLVAGWLASRDFNVSRAPDSQADRIVEGMRVEIKFSTLWKNGSYKFQQLRDQNYEFAVCLGVSPFDAHCWAIPKSVIVDQWHNRGGLSSQHGGVSGTDTAWLSVSPDTVPNWLQEYGGPMRRGIEKIAEMTQFKLEDHSD